MDTRTFVVRLVACCVLAGCALLGVAAYTREQFRLQATVCGNQFGLTVLRTTAPSGDAAPGHLPRDQR